MCLIAIVKHLPGRGADAAAPANARTRARNNPQDRRSQVATYKRLLLIQWLVQLFVDSTGYVPQTARRQFAQCDLPPALERIAMQAQRCSRAWLAWADEGR